MNLLNNITTSEKMPISAKLFIISLIPFIYLFIKMVVADTHKETTEIFIMALKYAIVLLVLWTLIFMIDFSKL
jgi:hypothetical protein